VNRGGLYGYFVKGQILESTIEHNIASSNSFASTPADPSVSSVVSTDLEDSDSTSSSAPSTSSNPLSNSDSDADSDEPTSSSQNTTTDAGNMGPRRNYGSKRNTSLVNGANSMPLGNNRFMAAQNNSDIKPEHSEEPVQITSNKPENKAKALDSDAAKPRKDKSKKRKHEDEGDLAVKPTVETGAVQEPARKPKKVKKEVVVESEVESLIDSEIDSEIDSDSDSGSDSDDSDTNSATDSDEDSNDDSERGSDDSSDDVSENEAPKYSNGHSQTNYISGTALNVIKVVDGISIPAPEIVIKEKQKKTPARVVRETRKMERKEKARQNAIEAKGQAIAEGTFDHDAEERKRRERAIDKIVKHELKRREQAGEFGPLLPHPTVLLKFEKEIAKELKGTDQLGDPEVEKRMMHEKLIVRLSHCLSSIVLLLIVRSLSVLLASTKSEQSSIKKRSLSAKSSSVKPHETSKHANAQERLAKSTSQ
jgi:hypothetical protein